MSEPNFVNHGILVGPNVIRKVSFRISVLLQEEEETTVSRFPGSFLGCHAHGRWFCLHLREFFCRGLNNVYLVLNSHLFRFLFVVHWMITNLEASWSLYSITDYRTCKVRHSLSSLDSLRRVFKRVVRACDGISEWILVWCRNGWKTIPGDPVERETWEDGREGGGTGFF